VPHFSSSEAALSRQAGTETILAAVTDQGSRTGGLEVEVNDQVFDHLRRYQAGKRNTLLQGFRNAEAYLDQVKGVFEKAGLPPELSNLAFLESGFNPFAYSRVGAAGIWQFMESTAKLFGLQVDWWVDERRDPEKSTQAAAIYLKRLHRILGSWPLAIAAYNAGEFKVLRTLRGRPHADLWSLPLPLETRRLLSAFMAVTLITKDPVAYSFPHILEDSPGYIKVMLDSCADLTVIAGACEATPEEILVLNPELNWGCTPPDRTDYEVRIPARAAHRFEEAFSGIPPEERIVWTRHRVQKGDTLMRVSRLHRVPMRMIAQMNHLSPPHSLRVGQELLLPVPQGFRSWAEERRLLPGQRAKASFGSRSLRVHVVRKGDTLHSIARHHGLTVKDLQQANRLKSRNLIRRGSRLLIPRAGFL
jgi:membrane-bound lytic murein transglycosylase D